MLDSFLEDRLPPQSQEAEESILGSILLDPEAMGRIEGILHQDAFYFLRHQIIYKAAIALYNQGQPTDLLGVITWLKDQGLLEKIGGTEYLAELLERTVSAVNIDLHANIVQEKYLRRKLLEISREITELGFDTSQDFAEIMNLVEQKFFSLYQKKQNEGLVPISEALINTFGRLSELQSGKSPAGYTCGFYDLDALTGGFQESDLVIVAARPSMGKTSFGVNVATNIAKQHNLPVAIFSLEMSAEQLAQRILSVEAGVESNRLRLGNLRPEELDRVVACMSDLADLPVFIDDSSTLTVAQIRAESRKLQAERGQLGLILVDYLQLMEGGSENRVNELAKISRSLKGLARELKVPVIALSQLSRAVEARNDKRPIMSDLRESGSLEQDADVVIMLYRDVYYNPDTPEPDIAEVIVKKHRNGPTGTVKMLFQSELTRFANLA